MKTPILDKAMAEMKRDHCLPQPRCFRIIRFFQHDRKPRTIKNGLTEAEAQEHCSKESTHGPGWFDGYDYMKGVKP